MDEKVTLVIGLTLIIVIGINVVLFFAFRDRSLPHQIDMFRQAAQRARDPWKDEDEALMKLAELVSKLKDTTPPQDQVTLEPAEKDDE
jgi:hypothetical protein